MNNGIAWMIERNSMFGTEWFCAGEDRWTKDANKAIHFPDEDSAKEIWFRLHENKPITFPYTETGGGDWKYTYTITDHGWISPS